MSEYSYTESGIYCKLDSHLVYLIRISGEDPISLLSYNYILIRNDELDEYEFSEYPISVVKFYKRKEGLNRI